MVLASMTLELAVAKGKRDVKRRKHRDHKKGGHKGKKGGHKLAAGSSWRTRHDKPAKKIPARFVTDADRAKDNDIGLGLACLIMVAFCVTVVAGVKAYGG